LEKEEVLEAISEEQSVFWRTEEGTYRKDTTRKVSLEKLAEFLSENLDD